MKPSIGISEEHLAEFSQVLSDILADELLIDHESIVIMAEQLKDVGTSDYLTGLTEYHEKVAWMLRSHLV